MIFSQQTIQCQGKLLDLSSPIVMGILNTTPDSFFSNSRNETIDEAITTAGRMIEAGVSIIDIGGMSSRPGAKMITEKEELSRVLPIIRAIHKHFPSITMSIDTFRSNVVIAAVQEGAAMVNDISAGKIDANMYKTVADLGVPYVLMHMRGKPESMQQQTKYDDVTKEVLDFLIQEVHKLRNLGVKDIIIDPGFGFGKSLEQNYTLLKQLHLFKILDCPILAGISRKSMIYNLLETKAEHALNGTSALHMVALQQDAKILRVHDVKEAVEVIQLYQKLEETN